jgi:hypothetical protein
MTDIRTGGLVREALYTTVGEGRIGGLVREALISGASTSTHLRLSGMARETLLRESTALVAPRQYAVTVNTG